MAETLNDAVIRLRLDTKDAKKDAESLRDSRGPSETGVTRPTPSAGGGRQGGGTPAIVAPSVTTEPPASSTSSAPQPGTATPTPQPGKSRPETPSAPAPRRTRRLERRVNRVEAQQAVGTLGTALASIPFVEVIGAGLAGAAIVEQFGPGVGTGIADVVERRAGLPRGTLDQLRTADSLVEELAILKSEVTSLFAALAAAKSAVGASAKIRELAGAEVDVGELANIGLAEAKIQRELSKLRNRSDYIEREALGKAMGGGLLDKAFDLSMGK